MVNFDFLVEAELISVAASAKNKSVEIKFVDRADGKTWLMSADGVDELYVSDFLLTNIVDRILFFDSSSGCDDRLSKNIFFMMRRKELSKDDLNWPPLKQKLNAVSSGNLVLIEIQAVYGAEVLLLAKKINIECY